MVKRAYTVFTFYNSVRPSQPSLKMSCYWNWVLYNKYATSVMNYEQSKFKTKSKVEKTFFEKKKTRLCLVSNFTKN